MNMGRTSLIIILASCFFLLYSCSNDGKDTIYVCSIQTEYWISGLGVIPGDLNGSYDLSGFDWDFYTVIGNHIRTISENDFDSYAGTMNIDALSVDFSYAISGSVNLTGRWYLYVQDQIYNKSKDSVIWDDPTTGTVVISDMPVSFTVSGDELTFIYPPRCFLLEDTGEDAEAAAAPLTCGAGLFSGSDTRDPAPLDLEGDAFQ